MKELVFQVEFISDIVLPATSNTEGNIEQLDFIPGSNFLGMVASKYDEFQKRRTSFDIFHSGKVRFGDATLLKNGKQTYKMPLSYFHEKLDDSKIFNHHLIKDFSQHKQLKQLRNGYITQDRELAYVEYNYSQKSAYDKEYRRSKDSSMYGYKAIKSGTSWQFTLKYSDDISSNDLDLIKSIFEDKKRLGKSKSAQYGEVKISLVGETTTKQESKNSSEVILYANSRLALIDEVGNPTYDLKYLCDGLEDKSIVYEKIQLKTSTFTPYNGKRQIKDYERVVINKGSVIVLKDISDEQLQSIQDGVGAYLSEGFGEILINPSFLADAEFSFKPTNNNEDKETPITITDNLAIFLQNREVQKQSKLTLANDVHNFIQNEKIYTDITNSQWGKIRSICTSGDAKFKDEIRAYVSSGKVSWKQNQVEKLLDDKYNLEFIKLLSTQMPKVKEQKNEN